MSLNYIKFIAYTLILQDLKWNKYNLDKCFEDFNGNTPRTKKIYDFFYFIVKIILFFKVLSHRKQDVSPVAFIQVNYIHSHIICIIFLAKPRISSLLCQFSKRTIPQPLKISFALSCVKYIAFEFLQACSHCEKIYINEY